MKPIQKTALPRHIYDAFQGDFELISTYHMVNGSLAECIRSTKKEIAKVADFEPLSYYSLYYNGKTIGFTVTGYRFLLSFGINISYRSKDIVMDWWHQVLGMFPEGFVTWLLNKNTRAIDFLKRNGMEIAESNDVYTTLLLPSPPITELITRAQQWPIKFTICRQEV